MTPQEIWDNPNEHKELIYKLLVDAYLDLSTCSVYFGLKGEKSYYEGIDKSITEIRKILLPK